MMLQSFHVHTALVLLTSAPHYSAFSRAIAACQSCMQSVLAGSTHPGSIGKLQANLLTCTYSDAARCSIALEIAVWVHIVCEAFMPSLLLCPTSWQLQRSMLPTMQLLLGLPQWHWISCGLMRSLYR